MEDRRVVEVVADVQAVYEAMVWDVLVAFEVPKTFFSQWILLNLDLLVLRYVLGVVLALVQVH